MAPSTLIGTKRNYIRSMNLKTTIAVKEKFRSTVPVNNASHDSSQNCSVITPTIKKSSPAVTPCTATTAEETLEAPCEDVEYTLTEYLRLRHYGSPRICLNDAEEEEQEEGAGDDEDDIIHTSIEVTIQEDEGNEISFLSGPSALLRSTHTQDAEEFENFLLKNNVDTNCFNLTVYDSDTDEHIMLLPPNSKSFQVDSEYSDPDDSSLSKFSSCISAHEESEISPVYENYSDVSVSSEFSDDDSEDSKNASDALEDEKLVNALSWSICVGVLHVSKDSAGEDKEFVELDSSAFSVADSTSAFQSIHTDNALSSFGDAFLEDYSSNLVTGTRRPCSVVEYPKTEDELDEFIRLLSTCVKSPNGRAVSELQRSTGPTSSDRTQLPFDDFAMFHF